MTRLFKLFLTASLLMLFIGLLCGWPIMLTIGFSGEHYPYKWLAIVGNALIIIGALLSYIGMEINEYQTRKSK